MRDFLTHQCPTLIDLDRKCDGGGVIENAFENGGITRTKFRNIVVFLLPTLAKTGLFLKIFAVASALRPI